MIVHGGESAIDDEPLASSEVMTNDIQFCPEDWHGIPALARKYGSMAYLPIEDHLYLCGGSNSTGGPFDNIISKSIGISSERLLRNSIEHHSNVEIG